MAKTEKCTFCGAPISGEPYWEVNDGERLPFMAKGCVAAYKDKLAGKAPKEYKGHKCTFCGAPVVGEPYWETIKLPFAAKNCAEEFKKKFGI